MNHSFSMIFLTGLILALIIAVPVSAESSTITSVSPTVGYTGTTTTVTITGTDFNTTSVKVKLMMEDESNITATISSLTSTKIVCKFTLSSSRTNGDWDLVVVNEDDSEAVDYGAFTIRAPIKLTSISPVSSQTNEDDVEFEVVGSGLADITDLYLYNTYYGNLSATLDDIDSTDVTGTFDLTDMTEATYAVCVMDSFATRKCGPDFEVTTDELGSIDISSTPSGASIYVDSEYVGTTPDIVYDLTTGSHKLSLVKAGYNDWGKIVKVTEGDTTTIDADLDAIALVTTARPTTVETTAPTTIATRISTIAIPTTWPATTTTTTTQASPVGILCVIGAVGLAMVALRK
jgi:hypothetical protein